MDTIAFIPARRGSKRVPEKNMALFKGKPLVSHTIEQAIEADIFGNVLVSTDDERIIEIASDYDVEILPRSPNLSGDDATLLNVIRDAVVRKEVGHGTCLGLLLVTAPLRTVDDLKHAYELFVSSDREHAVVSICQDINRLELAWMLQDEHLVPVFPDAYKSNIGKHTRKTTYHFNDACVFDLAGNFLREGRNLFGETPIPYVMPHERSIFVDYMFQLKMIQWIGDKEDWT